jgi:hypothetical protein
MNKSEDYYYKLENILSAQNDLSISESELKDLNLEENKKDPFVQALLYKYGIIYEKDDNKFFEFLNIAEVESYNDSHLRKFIHYQFSDYYLKCDINMKLYEIYFNSAISMNHKFAIQEKIEEMLDMSNDEKSIIELCFKGIAAGNDDCYYNLIECYEKMKDFTSIAQTFEILLTFEDKQAPHEFEKVLIRMYSKENLDIFIKTLILSNNKYTLITIKKYIDCISVELIKSIIKISQSENVLRKVLFIFDISLELFKSYVN